MELIFIGIWMLSVAIVFWGNRLVLRRNARSKTEFTLDVLPPISILKPLKGLDQELEKNLESFFKIDYPKYELLFSRQSNLDPCVPIVQKLIVQYPNISAKLFIEKNFVGINPKINNLFTSYLNSKHDWILISDSNIRADRNFLKNFARHLSPDVGLLTSAIQGVDPDSLGGHLESLHLDTFIHRSIHFVNQLGVPCAVGKSMMIRKSLVESWGGIQALGDYLAEDYIAGKKTEDSHMKVVVTDAPAQQVIGNLSVSDFIRRHSRWGALRKNLNKTSFFLEPIQFALVTGLIFSILFNHIVFLLVHAIVCMYLDRKLYKGCNLFKFICVWATREVLLFPIWFIALTKNSVEWRGNHFKLGHNTKLLPIKTNKSTCIAPLLQSELELKHVFCFPSSEFLRLSRRDNLLF